ELCPVTGLEDLFAQWYTRDGYEFTLEETLALIRDDQRRSQSENLALVLPGGGVKAAYQAVLLDHLFGDSSSSGKGSPKLIAKSLGAERRPRAERGGPLHVHAISGPSGGALTALFTALRPPPLRLTDLWISGGHVVASAEQVFPFVGLPRFASLVLLVLVF